MAIHPLFLHFPIALLFTGSLAMLWNMLRPLATQAAFEGFVNGVMGLGYAALIITIITGMFDMQASPKTLAQPDWITQAVFHILAAVSLLIIYGFLLYRRFVILPPASEGPVPPDRTSVVLLIIGLIMLITAGWLGGSLVYDYHVGIGA